MEHLDSLVNIVAILGSCVSVYLGIRVDLVKLHAKWEKHEADIAQLKEGYKSVAGKLHGHLETPNLHNNPYNRRSTDV